MTVQALYRRYRSQTFDELIGQEHVVRTLRNAIAEGRVAHAYLFTGPRGVGKTTVARLLAKAVNCTAPLAERPCGVCESCRSIAEGRAVDVIEMDAASHTSVEDAREIIERVQFRPAVARTKVYIIDEVHMLSTAAFNALLKTLEEPPPHALFILATTEVHKVPATILSRCQRFVFNRHTVASIAAHLRWIADQEGVKLEPGAAEAIARAATGSMRDALSVLDQLMAYGNGSVTLEQVRNLLGASEMQEVTALVDALIAADLPRALRVVADVAAAGADLRQFTRDLVERLRALMLVCAGADRSLLDVAEEEVAQIERQARTASLGALMRWVKLFSELDPQLRISSYGQLPLELAVIEAVIASAPVATRDGAVAAPSSSSAHLAAISVRDDAPPSSAVRPVAASTHDVALPQHTPAQQAPASARATAPLQHTPAQPAATPVSYDTSNAPAPRSEGTETDDAPAPSADVAHKAQATVSMSATRQPESSADPSVRHQEHIRRPSGSAVSAESAEGAAAANADAAALERIESIWPAVVRDVRVRNKTLQALLNSGARPVDVKGDTLILEAPTEWLMNRLEHPDMRQIIEEVLSKHMGARFSVRCVVETQRRENPGALREQIRTLRKDPLVRAAINIFDADIIAVEDPND
ncbi:MAG: DNA polymerase III subunit gamma/tau [Roseiflexus sp.]|nr:DNA polymerase III subunit gamma/tau [Roseiflexus sp.]MCS7290580.1 DNA polymerase III subunit gamma/tau [Roseiflexus sp.]MDW8148192.1 DNA polymerase III subunit gamma/tau [Roseiflexaceae bacterium]MDW8231907.1 DNA polymerase III subunit gamma/tau [Roseiflexaceae bacterium]